MRNERLWRVVLWAPTFVAFVLWVALRFAMTAVLAAEELGHRARKRQQR